MSEKLVIERVFDAPIETVWRAWTEPELFAQWYGPKECEVEFFEFELRPGGRNHHAMNFGRGPMYQLMEYVEIDEPRLIRWHHSSADAEGNVAPSPRPDWPLVLMTTVELEEVDGGTMCRLTWVPIDASEADLEAFAAAVEKNQSGWGMGFDNLEELFAEGVPDASSWTVEGRMQICKIAPAGLEIVRSFSAPREAVFRAFVEPDLIEQWMLGPDDKWSLEVDADVRPGGEGRFVWRTDEGREMAMTQTYEVIDAPTLIRHRELFDDDWTDGEAQITTRFEEVDGGTCVTMSIEYSSAAARDGAYSSGMADGMEGGYRRLDGLLV